MKSYRMSRRRPNTSLGDRLVDLDRVNGEFSNSLTPKEQRQCDGDESEVQSSLASTRAFDPGG